MTTQEHEFMMSLMSGLYQLSMTLFEILRRNGDATNDDLPAFSSLVSQAGAVPIFCELYRTRAEQLGLLPPR